MSGPEPKYDEIVVFTDEELGIIEDGGTVGKTVMGDVITFGHNHKDADLVIDDNHVDRLRNGNSLNYGGFKGRPNVSAIHIDYAGTPKSNQAAAERMFELFKESEGEARSVALEALHMLGYRVESEYTLVEKDD